MEKTEIKMGDNPNVFAGILFVIGFSGLSFEIVLSRIFSLLIYHDFVYLALSFAVLGLGIGAGLSPFFFRKTKSVLFPTKALVWYALFLPLPICLIPFLPGAHDSILVWIPFGLSSLPPFVVIGVIAGYIYRSMPEISGKLYAYDLCGAALGTLAAIPFLDLMGPYPYVFFLASLPVLTALFIQYKRKGKINGGLAGLSALLLGLAVLPIQKILFEEALLDRRVPGKPLFDGRKRLGTRIEKTLWNSQGRLDVTSNNQEKFKQIYTDGSVPATMYKNGGELDAVAHLRRFVGFAPFSYGKYEKVLSIGAGAGTDILLASLAGSKEITAVEVNRAMVDLVRNAKIYNGSIYSLPGVEVVVDEGRAFVRKSQKKYDIILFLLAQGSNTELGRVMTEDYLFTQEAFGDYFDRLAPGGKIAVAVHNPHRSSRYLMSWVAMLEKRGVSPPGALKRFAFLSYPDAAYRFLLIFHKEVLTSNFARALMAFTDSTKAMAIFIPGIHQEDRDLGGMARGEVTVADFIKSSPGNINISATSDDRPFQNNVYNGIHPGLQIFLILTLAFIVLIIAGFGYLAQRKNRTGSFFVWSLYAIFIGMGFMTIEVVFMRRLMLYLGHPGLALSVVLFAILVGSGLGSRFCHGLMKKKRLGAIKAGILILGVTLPFALGIIGGFMDHLLSAPVLIRSGAVIALLLVHKISLMFLQKCK